MIGFSKRDPQTYTYAKCRQQRGMHSMYAFIVSCTIHPVGRKKKKKSTHNKQTEIFVPVTLKVA